MLTRRLEPWEIAELHYKSEIQERINNDHADCNIEAIINYFLAKGNLRNSPLYNICQHYYSTSLSKYPSLMYWSLEDYFQECLLNFCLTMNHEQYGIKVDFKRSSSEDLNATFYVDIDQSDCYSSIIAHCKYILLNYVRMSKKDKVRVNFSHSSLDYLKEECGDTIRFMTLEEATWTPEFVEEQKHKGRRGRPKGSKNKSKE